jgi:hypothetical protein
MSRCGGVEKPLKKTQPGLTAALGYEPGTSLMQSGALSARPQCFHDLRYNTRMTCYNTHMTCRPLYWSEMRTIMTL